MKVTNINELKKGLELLEVKYIHDLQYNILEIYLTQGCITIEINTQKVTTLDLENQQWANNLETIYKQVETKVKELKKDNNLVVGASKRKDFYVTVKRLNSSDCWNVALSLAINKPYEELRTYAYKKYRHRITRDGGMYSTAIHDILLSNGYELFKQKQKTLRTFADDTQYTNYEYVVTVASHVVYIRYGLVYDTLGKDLTRIEQTWRRKINSRRKPIHILYNKEQSQLIRKGVTVTVTQ